MNKTLQTTAICGWLLGLALALPAQAENGRHGSPDIGAQSSAPYARTYVIVEEPSVAPMERATSRDNAGKPTRGAPGTGDLEREVALGRTGPYAGPRSERGTYR